MHPLCVQRLRQRKSVQSGAKGKAAQPRFPQSHYSCPFPCAPTLQLWSVTGAAPCTVLCTARCDAGAAPGRAPRTRMPRQQLAIAHSLQGSQADWAAADTPETHLGCARTHPPTAVILSDAVLPNLAPPGQTKNQCRCAPAASRSPSGSRYRRCRGLRRRMRRRRSRHPRRRSSRSAWRAA